MAYNSATINCFFSVNVSDIACVHSWMCKFLYGVMLLQIRVLGLIFLYN